MEEITEFIRLGKKIQAIKKFQNVFQCSLKEAKDAIEEMEYSGNYNLEYYKQKHDKHLTERRNMKSKGHLAVIIFLLVLASLLFPILYGATNIILPTLRFHTVAVELENGEVFEAPFAGHMIGAITRNGEYLIEFDVQELARFALFYIAPYYDTRGNRRVDLPTEGWEIDDSTNPWLAGRIRGSSNLLKPYYTSETVYHMPTKYHYESALYDQNGAVIWSYDDREKLKGSYTQRSTIGFSKRGSGNPIDFFLPNCINIHRFLAEIYDIEVKTEYDRKNRLIIFKVPQGIIELDEK